MGGGGCRNGNNPVKVVIINTQFVETDARSFKSVVQGLTGKNSTITAALPPPRLQSGCGAGVQYDTAPVFSRGMSFKDFERMLKELPPLDELSRLYSG
ncbi:hypothetical protein C2S52_013044 [Perilla frutescens var. hirtella]|nr:hypothetical protein C2S51_015385 [Perilla frutescens var. frutescens]KAH6775483.1 hypothetical protein C2S52_013044 [Perilla frutescens var. hirtella]